MKNGCEMQAVKTETLLKNLSPSCNGDISLALFIRSVN